MNCLSMEYVLWSPGNSKNRGRTTVAEGALLGSTGLLMERGKGGRREEGGRREGWWDPVFIGVNHG